MNIQIRLIDVHCKEDYDKQVELRSRILREPLGLKFSSSDLEKELDQVHVGAFLDTELVGCLLLVPQPPSIKMRQVAVDTKFQGQNIGRKLVEFSERYASEHGYTSVALHARQTAIPFYHKLGYQADGEVFEEVGIPHRFMSKSVSLLS